jgi:hypothetical protein
MEGLQGVYSCEHIVRNLVTGQGVWVGNWVYWIFLIWATNIFEYSTLVNSRNWFLTTAHTKPLQLTFTTRFLVTDPNNILVCSRLFLLATCSHLIHGCKSSHIPDCELPACSAQFPTIPLSWYVFVAAKTCFQHCGDVISPLSRNGRLFRLHCHGTSSPLCFFSMWPTLPLSLLFYSWLFPTDGSVWSHLLTLIPCSRIFLPWRWRRFFLPNVRLTQEPHSATSRKTTYFNINCRSILVLLVSRYPLE